MDDNQDMVATTEALLHVHGHQTKGCYNGNDALDCVRSFDPDVVLLDIRLPGKSGWDVAQEIRKAYPGKRPMLIAVTGELSRGDKSCPS